MKTIKYKRTLVALMLTIGLDVMGFLLIFPLFPTLFTEKHSLLVSAQATPFWHYFYYALALAVWPAGNFFGTAFLGEISDRVGRKKILLLGLFMVFVTYTLQTIAIYTRGLFLFIAARFIQGFFGGNYDIAQAAVADISPPERKARNMGLIALALSVGLVTGPIISALTVPSQVSSAAIITRPFWIASLLAIFNLIWISGVYQETYQPKTKKPIQLLKVFSAFSFVFTDRRIQRLGMVYFLLAIAWGLYIQQIPIIMQKLYHFTPHLIGYFFLVLGIGFVLAIQFLQPALVKRYQLKPIYITSMIILGGLLLIAGIYPLLDVEWVTVFLIAVFHITGYGCLLAIVSNAVTPDEQGQVMGGIGAVGSLAFGFSALSLAFFSIISILMPIILASIIYFVSGILLVKYKK